MGHHKRTTAVSCTCINDVTTGHCGYKKYIVNHSLTNTVKLPTTVTAFMLSMLEFVLPCLTVA